MSYDVSTRTKIPARLQYWIKWGNYTYTLK